jgi:HSP20 family molecular chaperone IbpA
MPWSAWREARLRISDGRRHRLERRYSTFSRTVRLPHGPRDAIRASYRDGVLEIRARKPE